MKMIQKIVACICSVTVLAATACSAPAQNETSQDVDTTAALETEKETEAQEETKTGKGKGFGGDVTVTLTLAAGVITDCAIDAPDETENIGGAALEELAAQVVAANGPEIDGVSGATLTSDGVKNAVKAALGDSNDLVEAMTPGTYTGSAMGMNDHVEVEVTVTETTIESIKVTKNQETAGIGAPLYNKDGKICENGGAAPIILLPEQIVEQQSLAVDTISGATVTSNAVIKAVGAAMTEAGADLADWQTESGEVQKVEVEHEADIIILGGGGAGLSAAISAGQQGAKVIVLEKTGLVGGDTLVCGATYNTWDPEGQAALDMADSVKSVIDEALAETPVNEEHAKLIEEVKAEWEAFKAEGKPGVFDSAAWYALQTWNGGDKVGDLDIIRTFADNSYSAYEWLLPLGMEFNEGVGQGAGSLWQRSHYSKMNMGTGFLSTYLDAIAELDNVTIYVNMEGKELVVGTDGKVTGVVCEDINGENQEFTAEKGVILATGGYSANGKLVQSYNTSGKWDDLTNAPTTNRYDCSQGDGIVMATDIGAATRDMDQIQLLYLGNLVDGGLTKYPSRCVTATVQTIFVNKEGNRFVQEDGRRDQICKAVLAQTDQMFYIIESADGSLYTDINDSSWRSADGFTRDFLEENGYIYVADTIEELAGKIGVDAAALQNSIDTYNACADAESDPEFGRTNFGCKLENGPYVATPRQASIHHTMGGLVIDTDTHVLGEDGKTIEGLYACGEIIGGLHGGNRLGGNAVTDVVVFGKLAGENAASGK